MKEVEIPKIKQVESRTNQKPKYKLANTAAAAATPTSGRLSTAEICHTILHDNKWCRLVIFGNFAALLVAWVFLRGLTGSGTTTTGLVVETSGSSGTSSSNHDTANQNLISFSPKQRTYDTPYDSYYQQHGRLALPKIVHAILPAEPSPNEDDLTKKEPSPRQATTDKILVVGDVHGCLDELIELHRQAVAMNHGVDLEHVILVGDLINKGPKSLEVLQYVQSKEKWTSIRGNHEEKTLHVALTGRSESHKKKFQWVFGRDKEDSRVLSDADVAWMSELPYTITIPATALKADHDTIVVHGGFLPGVPIHNQSLDTMTTVRSVEHLNSGDYLAYPTKRVGIPWASVWDGPQHVVFGHDASRNLQLYDRPTGIDTGAVQGRQLTGLLLPSRTLVTVESNRDYTNKKQERDEK